MLIRRDPAEGPSAVEGLRMAVGQSISNRVTVALVDAGVRILCSLESPGNEDIGKHLGMLARLGQRVWAEAESLDRIGVDGGRLPDGVTAVACGEVDRELAESEAAFVY